MMFLMFGMGSVPGKKKMITLLRALWLQITQATFAHEWNENVQAGGETARPQRSRPHLNEVGCIVLVCGELAITEVFEIH